MFARIVCVLVLLFCSGAQASGFDGTGGRCFATIEEAVTSAAYYLNWGRCGTGTCRILSYTPTSGSAQVINGAELFTLTVSTCGVVNQTLPTGLYSTPWFGSDPGVVSACGSTVSPGGGLTGTGTTSGTTTGTTVTQLTPEQALERYNDGVSLGWGVALATIAAFGVAVLGKAFIL